MRFVTFALLMLGFVGCNPPPRPLLSEIGVVDEAKVIDQGDLSVSEAPAPVANAVSFKTVELPWEAWHLYFVGGKKVGYLHLQSEIDSESSDENVRTTIEERILLPRGNSSLVQMLHQTGIETRAGECISFESDLQVGPSTIKSNGRVNFDELMIEYDRGGQQVAESTPWAEQVGGPAAIQQTLIAKPMSLNEDRRLRLLMPIQNRMATAELRCVNRASISTSVGQVYETFEIETQVGQEEGPITLSTLWVDAKGQLIKSYTPSTDIIAVRSTREEVEKMWDSLTDVPFIASINAVGSLSKPAEAYRVGFVLKPKADVKKGDFLITPQHGQYSREREDGAVQLLVSRDPADANRPGFTGLVSEPLPEDSASGPLIDSSSAAVRQLANLSKSTDVRLLAFDLVRTANQMIIAVQDSPAIVPASQTAIASGGSVASRAVLLAAMLRARDIPAKVVAGLTYREVDGKAKMVYHAWTIAWIEGAWLPLDPTTGQIAPADRIALSTSSLAESDQFKFFSPLLAAVAQLNIEIGNAKYQLLE